MSDRDEIERLNAEVARLTANRDRLRVEVKGLHDHHTEIHRENASLRAKLAVEPDLGEPSPPLTCPSCGWEFGAVEPEPTEPEPVCETCGGFRYLTDQECDPGCEMDQLEFDEPCRCEGKLPCPKCGEEE